MVNSLIRILKTQNGRFLYNGSDSNLDEQSDVGVMKSLSSEQFPVANQQRRNRNRKKQSFDVRTFLP